MSQAETTQAATTEKRRFAPLRWLKDKRVSYLTLPLLIMASLMELVILATGWRYQQLVCLPQGMGVTFLGIGPIGATILAVELLKLPLAVWTSSRRGWQKGFMLLVGLPLICLLTFQLVKDMAVYEMGVAMEPATEMLERASVEENKIAQLSSELSAIEKRITDGEERRTDLAARHTKAKQDLEEALKHQTETRLDAVTLTEYEQTELAEVESRQAAITKRFDADTAQLTAAVAGLRKQREIEVSRATKWKAEDARIENDFKVQIAHYNRKIKAYKDEKAHYDRAHPVKRMLMTEPVHPGVAPIREINTVLKPVEIAEIDAQIKAKEAELVRVNEQRRDRLAQVEADARRVRAAFEERSNSKRAETDRKREELLAAHAALTTQWAAQQKDIDLAQAAAVEKMDVVRAELNTVRAGAEKLYEAREEAIKNTQVHRIATTVEIVRGWLFGQRPISITAGAKERGDLFTDQISMVRIWVYPVLAFIVAFLPTLLVEIAFSTIFQADKKQPTHRLGFMGRRLHWLYTRAGRQRILRAERLAREARNEIVTRDKAVAAAEAAAETALAEKDTEIQAVQEAASAANARHEAELKSQETEWVAKYTELAESLNRAVAEGDALRDLQKSEVERQVQLRQQAWSDRLAHLRKELDDQRAATETDRATLLQEHDAELLKVTEDCKTQVAKARRQAAAAEMVAAEKSTRLTHDLQQALQARDAAETELKRQEQSLTTQLSQARDEAARELEKAVRQEKLRQEHQQADWDKKAREQDEQSARCLKQREQELAAAFELRLMEETARADQAARQRETELIQQAEAQVRELDAQYKQEQQHREDAAALQLKQLEQKLQAQAAAAVHETQQLADQYLERKEKEWARRLDAQSREAKLCLQQDLQQKELSFHAALKQREQDLTAQAAVRESELQKQFAADLQAREEESQRQAESAASATATRLNREMQQQEEMFQTRLRQREQQLQSQFDASQAERKAQWDREQRVREQELQRETEARVHATDTRHASELRQRDELLQSKLSQRDEQWQRKLNSVQAELQSQAEQELHRRETALADAHSRTLCEREAQLRKELEDQFEAALADTRKRERELASQLTAAAQAQKTAEKERDDARQSANQVARQMVDMKQKLIEASTVLADWKKVEEQPDLGTMIVR